MANRSIVSRLIWLLASALAGLWLLGSVAAAMLTRFEVNERLDNTLEEAAQRLMPIGEGLLSEPEAMRSLGEHLLPALDPRAIAYQIVSGTGQLILRSPNAPEVPFNSTPQRGFHDGPHYRVYTAPVTNGPYWLEVAEPQTHRREAVSRAIELAVSPLLAFLPLSWIVIRWAVRRSFSPLVKLQSEIGSRSGTNLAQIPDLQFPAELLPIHTRAGGMVGPFGLTLNQCLFRLASARKWRLRLSRRQLRMRSLVKPKLAIPSSSMSKDSSGSALPFSRPRSAESSCPSAYPAASPSTSVASRI
jgi:two-component system OmpR family sensor kinase